ncbi:MAG: pyridoxamine 5'-phosphate oxidase family protein [Acidobacteria bacterium]|nr:pyridoxamine 5'-phosphate oxidase family protein [Acidobacteriota bacterium]
MTDTRSAEIYELDDADCWALLERGALGRLAVAVADLVDIYPVNYAVDDRRLYFKTAEGSKLAALVIRSQVAFEIDGVDDQTAWSVVVKGDARLIDRVDERAIAERLPIVSWLPTVKRRIVVIDPVEVTGRAFLRGAEPDAEWY